MEPEVTEVRALIYDIYEAAGAIRGTGQALARAEGLTLAQWTLLETVQNYPQLTVARAARRLGVSRQSVQKTANELADQGHLAFLDNPDHKTSPLVDITPTGAEVLERMIRSAADANKKHFHDLTAEEVATTRQALQRMTKAIYENSA
jgi:DNA-binding MarR family transcriptional regulator